MIGDIVGKPGREAVRIILPGLKEKYALDLVIANAENVAGGVGVTPRTAEELFDYGIDVLTSGNHVWDRKEIYGYIETCDLLLRPNNYPPGTPGSGVAVINLGDRVKVLIANLMGRVYMSTLDCPFRQADELCSTYRDLPIKILDFHAEITSEKVAMGWHLDGRATAVLCTHTHVPTADAKILPQGTAYVTDVGMVGPYHSVLGLEPEVVTTRFLTQMPSRSVVAKGPVWFNSVVLEIDEETGRAKSIFRHDEIVEL